jgi:hypothetical protein
MDVSTYLGTRVRMRAKVKTDAVAIGAAIWFRIDSAGQPIALCNMIDPVDRQISGTRDFTEADCVLDVPSSADAFVFGALLRGPGTAWFGTATFEQVGSDVPESPRSL